MQIESVPSAVRSAKTDSAKHLKIANVIEDGRLAGPQIRMIRVAAQLAQRIETTIIMPADGSQAFQQWCSSLLIQYKTLWLSRLTRDAKIALRYVVFSPFEIGSLAWYLRKGGFDLVHVSGGSWQFKGAIAGRLAGVRVVWHLNDTSMPWVIRQIFAFLSKLADGFIYSCERARTYYGKLVDDGKPSFVILPPVDTLEMTPTENYSGDEAIIQRLNDTIVVGMVAHINPIKGLETLVRAVAAVNAEKSNVRFVVIGPVSKTQSGYFEKIKNLCAAYYVDNIEFVGGRNDTRALLKRFDIYICTSLAETGPMAVWEAMSMQTPIVSTNVGDVALYVKEGCNGFVADVGDWRTLADKVVTLAGNEAMRQEYGRASREVAIRELDIKRCAELHFQAYSYFVDGEMDSGTTDRAENVCK